MTKFGAGCVAQANPAKVLLLIFSPMKYRLQFKFDRAVVRQGIWRRGWWLSLFVF